MIKISKKIAVLFSVLIVLTTSAVFAYMGDPSVQGPFVGDDRHEAMQKAFDEKDYKLWEQQMTLDGKRPGVLNMINENNFEKFAQMKEEYNLGNIEKAEELREELGLGQKNKNGQGTGMKKGGTGNGKHMNGQGKNYNSNYNGSNNGNCPIMQE